MMLNKADIEAVLHRIHDEFSELETTDISLMEGMPGPILFLDIYYKYIGRKTDLPIRLTEKLIDHVNSTQEEIGLTYCDGLVGFLAFCNHIGDENDHVFIDYDEALLDFLSEQIDRQVKNDEIDFLHGALGIIYYQILRLKVTANPHEIELLKKKLINDLINIKNAAIEDSKGLRWNHPVYNDERFIGKPFFNLGMAHGLPSFLSLLADLHDLKIAAEKTAFMIQDAFRFLLSLKSRDPKTFSQFQTYYIPHHPLPYDSRLAWCYGDLSLALAILKAGRSLGDQSMINEAIAIGLVTTQRRSEEETLLTDADFCHGTSGVAHMYGVFYELTNNDVFKTANEYWMAKTLNLSDNEDGIAGFRTDLGEGKWGKDEGLLRGVAGIGLVLLSYLTGNRTWDKFLLLP